MKSLAKLALWCAAGCALLLCGGTKAEAQTTVVRINCAPAYGPSYVGSSYSATCTGTGGSSSYTFAIDQVGGNFPAGLKLTPTSATTATVTGTPTTAGSYAYGVTMLDNRYGTVSAQSFSGTINGPINFACGSNNGPTTVGTAYSDTCSVTNGQTPLRWSISSGSLPAGLSLTQSGTQATISGTPTSVGSYGYQLQAVDTNGLYLGGQYFQGLVGLGNNCTSSFGPTETGSSYSDTCTVVGGTAPYTWSIGTGALPAGLTLSSLSGTSSTVSGIPTTAGGYSYTVSVRDSAGYVTARGFNGTIDVGPPSFTCTSNAGPTSTGSAYSDTCTASGGSGGYSWSISSGSLPAGVTLTSSGTKATIAGTPSATGSYSYILTVTDLKTAKTGNQPFSGTVTAPLTITCGSANGPVFTGYSYSDTCNASGGTSPYSWSIYSSSLPAGLTLSSNGATATISGTSTTAGSYNYGLQLSDSVYNSAYQFFNGTLSAPPTISSINPTSAQVNAAAFTLTVNGTNFNGNSNIYFNGTALTTAHYSNTTLLTATVPASALTSPGNFTVAVAQGSTIASNSTANFAVAPTLTSITPTSTVAGSGQFTLTLNGAGFLNNSGTSAYWNGTALATTFTGSTTSITAVVPANLTASPGRPNVTVTANGVSSIAQVFTIQAVPVPTLTSISPTSITAGSAQFILTANGTNFASSAVVLWNGQALTTSSFSQSGNQVNAIVPASLVASPGQAQVSVQSGNTPTGSLPFTINAGTTIASISPASATAGGPAFALTIDGANLNANDGAANITFNGTALTVTSATATRVVATVPANLIATAGTYNVTAQGFGSSSTSFTVLPAPTLASINPTSATAGGAAFNLLANGANFTSSSVVQWNGQTLTTTFVSAAQLSAAVPASLIATAGTARVTVAQGGVASAAQTFTINAPVVTLTAINPTSATAGGPAFTLSATGTNFTSGSVVQWNGQSLTTTFTSATQLSASVPATLIATAGTAQVTVLTGTAPTTGQTFTIQAASTLASINPTSATAGGPAFNLTATGTNFTTSSVLRWNGQNLSTGFTSATQLTAAVPATLITSEGTAQVSVSTGGVVTANVPFTILAAPSITSLNPNTKTAGSAAFSMTVLGANFTSATSVLWNGTALTITSTATSATQLTVSVPANLVATAGNAGVTVSQGNVTSSPATFIITPAPTLASLNPNSATVGAGNTPFTVNGAGFAQGATILFNGQALTTAFVTANQLTATIPASALTTTGTFPVTVTSGGVTTATSLPFSVGSAPTVTSLNPNSTAVGGVAFALTVNGTGFTAASVVQWNGGSLNTATTFVSATQLTTTVPASFISSAGINQVSVLTGSVSSNNLPFNVYATPTLTNLSPTQAAAYGPAFTLTVNGTGFASGATIYLNGSALTTTFVSSTQLTAAIPADYITTLGRLPVTVTSASVASSNSLNLQAVSQTLTALSPSSASAGGAGFTLTVTGTGFGPSSTFIYWNGETQLPTTVLSGTQASATVPASLIASAGTAQVTLVSSDGAATNALTFTINAGPTLSSIDPTSATVGSADLPVTVTGTGFSSNAVVGFGAVNLATIVVSSTQLTATIPAAQLSTAGTFLVIVTSGNVQTNQLLFRVVTAPTLTSVNPNSVVAGGSSFSLTLTGNGFASNAAVSWNGASLTVTSFSATQLIATVPASLIAGPGTAQVAVQSNGVATGSLPVVINPAPNPAITISSLSPSSAVAGGSTFTLAISGTNVNVINSAAYFNGTLLTTLPSSGTQLNVSVPAALIANAGNYTIEVRASGYTTGSSTFTVTTPAAALSSLNPNSVTVGAGNTPFIVNGSGFAQGATILFNGQALTTTFVNANQLSATIPASSLTTVNSFPVTVVSSGVTTAASLPFAVVAAPTVTSLNPTSSTAGGAAFTLTVNGTGFTTASIVQWNGGSLTTTYGSATLVRASVPASLISAVSTNQVSVINGTASSNTSPFSVFAAATLTSLSPTQAPVNGPAFTLTVNGTGFATGAVINLDGLDLTTTFVSANQLTASIAANGITRAGGLPVYVTSAGVTTNTLTLQAAALTLTGLSPNTVSAGGPDFTLTVTGTGFQANSTYIVFNRTQILATVQSATQASASVPRSLIANAGVVPVAVLYFGGNPTPTLDFTVVAGPSLSSIDPTSVTVGSADLPITANGTGFGSSAAIVFNGTALATTVVSSTQLTATIPAAQLAATGTFPITVTSGGVPTSAIQFSVLPALSLSAVSPTSVTAGGADFTLTATGTGFSSGAAVLWNGTSLTVTSASATQLLATVPASLIATGGSAQVTVRSNGVTTGNLPVAINAPPAITVTSLNPSSAVAGGPAFPLTISGTNLNVNNAAVYFNNTQVATITANSSATQYTLNVPAALIATAGTYTVQVQATGYTPGSLSFTVLPAPTVTLLSPNTITAGSTAFPMTVNGASFTPETSVLWNGVALAATYVNATQLTANVPASLVANAGSARVSVSLGGVTSTPVTFTISNAPTLSSLNPNSVTVGSGQFTLQISGSGFASGAVASFNGAALNTTFVNAGQLNATVPASLLTTTGSFPVTVTSGGVTAVGSLPFAVLAAPTLTSLSPNTTAAGGPAFNLLVNGTGFTTASTVQWNGASLVTTLLSSTQLRAAVPAALITAIGIEQVTVINGTASSNALPFSVVATPTLTSLDPSQTVVGSAGFTLTVNGSGFASGSTVSWGDGETSNSLATTFVSPTQLTAAVPASYLTSIGTFSISVTSSGVVSGNTLDFQVVAQSLTSLSPNAATAGGPSFTLTVNGAGFGPDATVVWGESSLTTTFINSTQVTAIVPASFIASAGTAPVLVLSNNTESSNSLPFTIVAGPTLSTLSPNTTTAGGPAFTLTVNGTGFASDATVLFNGAALTTTFVSATQVTAAIPASQITTAGSYPVTVTSGGVATLTSLPFTVSAAPTLSAVSPNTATAGSGGFPITITGTGFTSSTSALWNGTALASTFVSATQLTAAIPASLVALSGINQVTVSAGNVSSNSLPFTVTAAASLTSLSPSTTTAGGPAFTMAVNGSGFGSDAIVLWNSTRLATTFVNATQVTANVPANLITTVAAVPVSVITGGVTSVNFLNFTITAGAILTSVSPNTATAGGAALTLTVNGTGFASGATVLFNGAALTTTFVSATQVTATVPASQITTAGTYPITIVSGGVATVTSLQFTVVTAPTLSSINPNSAIAGSGNFNLTANGTGFTDTSIVNWNGSPLTTTFVSATQLTAAVPAGLTVSPGTSVVAVSQGGLSSNSLNFTTAAAPTFVSLSPATVTAGSAAFTLTVNGGAFVSGATVLWNGAALTTTFVNSTQLRAAVPASLITTPGSVSVNVISGNATLGPLTLTIVSGPAISALNPATATAGSPAFTLTVTGTGFAPGSTVQWNGSALPATVASSTQVAASVPASLVATPGTAAVTVTSGGATSNSLTFTIASTQTAIAPVSLVGLPASAPAGSTQSVGVQLGNAAPVPLQGTLQLSFTPSVSGLPAGYIDPHVVFASGSATSVNFTIPVGGTVANIPQGGAISLGTVAGTIAVTLTNLTSNGVSVLPGATVTSTVVVQPTAPVITDGSVKITNVTTNGFTVALTGYSTTREVITADFIFTAANGSQLLGSTEFTVPVNGPFATWFSSTQGQTFGSQFSLQMPFTISGSTTSVVQGVSVTLRNSAGTSTAVSGTK